MAEVKLGRQRSPKDHDGTQMRQYLRAANVGWGGLQLDDVKAMNFTDAEMRVFKLQPGDLLLNEASGSAGEVGKPALWSGEIDECAFQNTLIRVRPREHDPRFLLHYFRYLAETGRFASQSRGVGIYHLGRLALADWPVPLPPIEEQRRIAAILDQADELRAKRRASATLVVSLTDAVFVDMFGDPAINARRFPRRALREIGHVVTGNTPPRARAENFGDAIEWIKSDNITPRRPYLTIAREGLSEKGMGIARLAPANALLVTCIAGSRDSIGNAAISDRPVAFNQQLNALVPLEADVVYLYGLFRAAKRLVQAASTDSMKGMISKSKFAGIQLPIAPLDLQRQFAARALAVWKTSLALEDASKEFDALFSSLQHRAFSGAL